VEVFYRAGRLKAGIRLAEPDVVAGRQARVIRLTPDAKPEYFSPARGLSAWRFRLKSLVLATNNSLYRVDAGIEGLRIT
jgi:hypothetical protein